MDEIEFQFTVLFKNGNSKIVPENYKAIRTDSGQHRAIVLYISYPELAPDELQSHGTKR